VGGVSLESLFEEFGRRKGSRKSKAGLSEETFYSCRSSSGLVGGERGIPEEIKGEAP